MKRMLTIIAIALFAILMFSCDKERKDVLTPQDQGTGYGIFHNNPLPPDKAQSPTIQVNPGGGPRILHGNDTPILEPDPLIALLTAGQSICEKKTLHLPPQVVPEKADILFSFDLTGSMWAELANVKANSINIMNAIRGIVTDSWFGVISHMDYPASYNYCNYSDTYGDPLMSDYAYMMNQSIINNMITVSNSINMLSNGSGVDEPEDYTRIFHETWNDPSISFRAGAQKFLVAFLDAVPHDCNYDAIIGGTGTTGPDPGRDGIAGNADDLQVLNELNQLKVNGIIPIIIFSGNPVYFPLWQAYAAHGGGAAFQINDDGTIPGDIDIATYIASLISSVIKHYDVVTLQTCEATYSSWLTSVTPASYTNVVLGEDLDLLFDVCITVPDGTAPGEYCFEICALGDGTVLAKQKVCITVVKTSMDIKPNSCPNPLNTKDNGKLPVAILGSSSFDVSKIDASTIRLVGVAPLSKQISDVAGPFEGDIQDCYDCTTAGSDGYPDLTLKFSVPDIVNALGTVEDRSCKILELTGKLKAAYGGTSFKVYDIVRIQKR